MVVERVSQARATKIATVRDLIESKADYEFCIEADRIALAISRKRPKLIEDDIWWFQRLLRKA